jgi:hypothetical protein
MDAVDRARSHSPGEAQRGKSIGILLLNPYPNEQTEIKQFIDGESPKSAKRGLVPSETMAIDLPLHLTARHRLA